MLQEGVKTSLDQRTLATKWMQEWTKEINYKLFEIVKKT